MSKRPFSPSTDGFASPEAFEPRWTTCRVVDALAAQPRHLARGGRQLLSAGWVADPPVDIEQLHRAGSQYIRRARRDRDRRHRLVCLRRDGRRRGRDDLVVGVGADVPRDGDAAARAHARGDRARGVRQPALLVGERPHRPPLGRVDAAAARRARRRHAAVWLAVGRRRRHTGDGARRRRLRLGVAVLADGGEGARVVRAAAAPRRPRRPPQPRQPERTLRVARSTAAAAAARRRRAWRCRATRLRTLVRRGRQPLPLRGARGRGLGRGARRVDVGRGAGLGRCAAAKAPSGNSTTSATTPVTALAVCGDP